MITHYPFLNRELGNDVYGAFGVVLVVLNERVDCINFYNEMLRMYQHDTGALCSINEQTISSKATKIIVKQLKDSKDYDNFRGLTADKIFAVGKYTESDFEFLQNCFKKFPDLGKL